MLTCVFKLKGGHCGPSAAKCPLSRKNPLLRKILISKYVIGRRSFIHYRGRIHYCEIHYLELPLYFGWHWIWYLFFCYCRVHLSQWKDYPNWLIYFLSYCIGPMTGLAAIAVKILVKCGKNMHRQLLGGSIQQVAPTSSPQSNPSVPIQGRRIAWA